MPQQAHVLYCVQFNTETNSCTQQVWMPAPQLLPPLSASEVSQLLSATLVAFIVAYGWKELTRQTKN